MPAALLLGSLAVGAVTVTACAVVFDGGRGGPAGWAEAAATQTNPAVPTPRSAATPGPPAAPGAVQRSWSTIKLMFR